MIKYYKLLKEGKNTPFMAMYGSRRLTIRTEFAKYLEEASEVKEEGVNGKENQVTGVTPSTGFSAGVNPSVRTGNTSSNIT